MSEDDRMPGSSSSLHDGNDGIPSSPGGSRELMQSIAVDLQQIEDHLETPAMLLPPVAASGRAVFDSIRTTLGSIRTRLESAIVGPQLLEPDHSSENLPQQPSTVLVAISSTALSERLRTAELSHSSRMPLGLLQRELSRRRECSNASLQSPTVVSSSVASADTKESCRADTNSYRDESADRSERDTEIISNLDNSAAPPTRLITRRRTSTLLASRRRAEQIQGPRVDMDLHGTVRATSLGGTRSSLPDTGNTATKVNPRGGSDSTIVEDSRVRDDMKGSSSNDEEAIEIIWATLACEKQEIPILLTRLSFSKLDAARRSVLFSSSASLASPDEMEIDCTETEATLSPRPSTTVYSWGQGLHTLHDDSEPTIAVNDALVASTDRVGRSDVVSVAVGQSHTVVATSSGQIMACGDNTDGAVDPDRREDGGEDTNNLQHFLSKPIVIESISFMTQITQVSCGANHTAALRANGAVLTWGSNENGQLGQRHLTTAPESEQHFCRPAVFALGPGRRATQIACGDGFSLVLTSRMGLLACGVECIAGYGRAPNADQDGRRALQLPSPISALEELPLVAVSAGKRHAVVITAHGSAFSWGENLFGQVGREYPETAIIPTPMRVPRTQMTPIKDPESILKEPLTNWGYLENSDHISLAADVAVVDAACGASHTVLVTRSGGLLVCGSNAHGQLGIDWLKIKGTSTLTALSHADAANGRRFVKAEAGSNHTLLLDDIGDVWVFDDKVSVNRPALKSKAIHLIAAGGDLCVAVSNNLKGSSPSIPMAIDEDGVFCLAESVEELIRNLSTKQPDDLSAVDDLASRTEELLSTPSVLNSLFLDPSEFEDFFRKLIDVEVPAFRRRITLAIEKGIQRGLDTLCADEARLMYPEQVRFLLLYLHCPLFVEWKRADSLFDRRGDLILALCETILSLPYEGYRGLITWAESIFSREDFVRLLVKPLLTQLKKALSVEAGAERRPIPAIIGVLRWFYSVSDQVDTLAQPEDFYSDAVAALPPGVMFDDLVRYKRANKQQRAADFFFCDNPFLFSPNAKRNMLQMESEMNMLKTAASGATFNLSEQTYEINPFYVLEVDRQELLPQTLKKISKAQPNDLRKKLRVVFKGEEGIDAGGVTREYFQLLSAQLFDVNSGMWSNRFGDDSRITWFNSDCIWDDDGYFLVGVLVGLALYNSVLLDVHFPQAVYRKLLGLPLGLEDMVDEEVKSGLQHLLDYSDDDVEDVFCLTFDVAWTDLGEEKRKELKPGGIDTPVTSDNKEEYVILYVKWLLVDSIYPQYEAFERGFMRVMENSSLDLLRPQDLELLVVGTPELDFNALMSNTQYEGGYDSESAVVRNFWKFVEETSHETRLNLLKFATGSSKAPIGGLGELSFKIQKSGPDSDQLPSSHTCFNTLLLPDYGENYNKLAVRLGRAVIECEGFGLQ